MKKLFLALVLILLTATSANAGKPTPWAIVSGQTTMHLIVNQQSPDFLAGGEQYEACFSSGQDTCVYNYPMECSWNTDDGFSWTGEGTVDIGQTITQNACLYADGYNFGGLPHRITGSVTSSINNLVVQVTSSQGLQWVLLPTQVGRAYQWRFCHIDQTPGPHPIVEGSHGGVGTRVDYTLSITAPKSVKVTSVFGSPYFVNWVDPCSN